MVHSSGATPSDRAEIPKEVLENATENGNFPDLVTEEVIKEGNGIDFYQGVTYRSKN